jgi:hypothetical protein
MSKSKRYSEGNKGSDHSYRGSVLRGLAAIVKNTQGSSGLATAIAALTAAVQDHQEFELKLVRDIDSGTVIVQRNEYDETTDTWSISYVDADGAPFLVGGSGVEYMDPETVLITIDNVLDQIKLDTAKLDVNLSTRASETTVNGIKTQTDLLNFIATALEVNVSSSVLPTGAATELTLSGIKTKTDLLNFIATALEVTVTSSTLPAGAATEVTLAAILACLCTGEGNIKSLLSGINSDTSALVADIGAKVPISVASTGITNIPAGTTEISIFNNGTGDATVNGVKCPPGVTRTFGFKNPTSAIIVCDGGTTEELIIDYML